ncbi:hypothetical protein phiPLPE_08 [Iodobacter phage PhiPLPE]|uniref:Uncharacterized protein n=1 Tax=Iodobacter phage PhiPLPE TaxID=551895 RepID=B5AX27_9CAUD|nr:hypothetical protein phiPLPE_08 [Iodobacter phage PhiPLPE]ACG60330.1 hypothetical protein phiPLPE_08 [Iodobacter phage PhiPLPE]
MYFSAGTMKRQYATAGLLAFTRGGEMKPRIRWQRWLRKWVCKCDIAQACGSTPAEAFDIWKKVHMWRKEDVENLKK